MDRIKNELLLKELMTRISTKLKEEKEKKEWDSVDIIIRSGISVSALYNIERGTADNITLKNIIALATALDMDVISLLQSPPTA